MRFTCGRIALMRRSDRHRRFEPSGDIASRACQRVEKQRPDVWVRIRLTCGGITFAGEANLQLSLDQQYEFGDPVFFFPVAMLRQRAGSILRLGSREWISFAAFDSSQTRLLAICPGAIWSVGGIDQRFSHELAPADWVRINTAPWVAHA